jgi:hypothetical protein
MCTHNVCWLNYIIRLTLPTVHREQATVAAQRDAANSDVLG